MCSRQTDSRFDVSNPGRSPGHGPPPHLRTPGRTDGRPSITPANAVLTQIARARRTAEGMDIQGDDKSEAEADGSEQEIRDHGRSGLRGAGFPKSLVPDPSGLPYVAARRPPVPFRRIE